MTDEDIARDAVLCDPGTNRHFVADASYRWPKALKALTEAKAALKEAMDLADKAIDAYGDDYFHSRYMRLIARFQELRDKVASWG